MADPKAPEGGYKQGGWYEGRQYWNGTFSEKGQINKLSDQQGAGQMVSKEVVDAGSIQQGKAPEENWNYLHGQQAPTSKEQITPYLNNFQESAFSQDSEVPTKTISRTPDEVKAMLTPEMAKPEQFSSAEEFAKLREEKGIAGLEAQLNDLTAQEDEEMAFFRQQRFDERGKPVAMGVIQGRISEEETAAAERMDVIGRQKSRINDQLQTSYSVINMMMGFMEGDYQRASEAYNSEFNNNLQMYNIVRGEERDARSDFESDRANASANLTTYMNAVTSGNLSYNNLDPVAKTMINKLEMQSGMPIGFVSNLQMSAGDRLVTFNDKTGEALMVGDNGNLQVIQTGMKGAGGSNDPGSKDYSRKDVSAAMKILNDVDKGFVTENNKLVALDEYEIENSKPDNYLSNAEANEALRKVIEETGDKELGEELFYQAWIQGGYQQWGE